jgi:hypothetical protein
MLPVFTYFMAVGFATTQTAPVVNTLSALPGDDCSLFSVKNAEYI